MGNVIHNNLKLFSAEEFKNDVLNLALYLNNLKSNCIKIVFSSFVTLVNSYCSCNCLLLNTESSVHEFYFLVKISSPSFRARVQSPNLIQFNASYLQFQD